ncbi:MAG: CARDB domain-containing protein, partial [Thermoplasmatota archaeon]
IRPPGSFSSPLVADINLGDTPEILVGAGDGLYCIDADGTLQWKYPVDNGSVFCAPTLSDLDGKVDQGKEDMEIVFIADLEDGTSELVVLTVRGSLILEQTISWEFPGTASSVVAADLDGSFWDGCRQRTPEPEEETAMELIVSSYGRGVRIFAPNDPDIGPSAGYHLEAEMDDCNWSTATPAVCNMDTDPELELAFALNIGADNDPANWKGGILVTDWNLSVIGGVGMGDNGSAIIGSPAVGDIDGGGHDEWKNGELDLVYCTTGGVLNVLPMNGSVMNFSFDSGAPILSSPAFCDVDIDSELEIIIANEDGKIFMMDGDPSDGIDEGVPYPNDGDSQDVLWYYYSEIPVGISSPVVADINLDGMLEVVIGASEDGMILCIAAGDRAMKGQKDWTTFHGRNDRTGYYSRPVNIGVDIYPSWIDDHRCDPMVKSVSPGNWTHYNLTVELTGWGVPETDREMVRLSIEEDSVPRNWSAWIDTPADRGNQNPDYVRLASTETAQIVLWVKAPWEGVIGEMARISVDAILKSDPFIEDTATTLSVLDLYVGYEMEFLASRDNDPNSTLYNKKVRMVDIGETIKLTLHIKNMGNMNDTYTLNLSKPPAGLGWDWYFEKNGNLSINVSLTAPSLITEFGGTSENYLIIVIHAPSDGYAGMTVPMKVTPDSYLYRTSRIETIQYPDTVYLMIRVIPSLTILLTQLYYEVEPGGTVNLEAVITNNGNIKDMVVDLIILDNDQVTSAIDRIEPFVLTMSERVHKFLNLSISPYARSDLVHDIAFIVRNASSTAWDSAHLSLRITKVTGLEVGITLKENIIQSGQTIEGEINITSRSNFIDPVTLSCIVPGVGISVEFRNSSGLPESVVEPEPFSTMSLKVLVTTSIYVSQGTHQLPFVISTDSGLFVNRTLNLTFTDMGWIIGGFYSSTTLLHRSVDYGDRISLSMSYRNNRSIPVTMEFTIASDFAGELMTPYPLESWVHAGFTGVSFTTGPKDGIDLQGSYSMDLTGRNIEPNFYYWFKNRDDNISHVRSIMIDMNPHTTLYLDMEFMVRTEWGEEVVHEADFMVLAMDRQWGVHSMATALIGVNYPDLEIVGGPVFKDKLKTELDSIEPDEEFLMVFEIMNSGDAPSDQVFVNLSIDGGMHGQFLLPSMDPGEITNITFWLELGKGKHTYILEIDSGNDVHELEDQFTWGSNETNNILRGDIDIKEKAETPWLLTTLLVAASVMIAALVIMYFMLIARKSLRDEE